MDKKEEIYKAISELTEIEKKFTEVCNKLNVEEVIRDKLAQNHAADIASAFTNLKGRLLIIKTNI